MSHQKTIGEVYRSQDVEFVWELKNFTSLSSVCGHFYDSPAFNFAGRSWSLVLYTNGVKSSKGWISLYLKLDDPTVAKEVIYTFRIKTVKGKILNKRNCCHRFSEAEPDWGYSKAFQRSEALSTISKLQPPDCLTITVNIRRKVSSRISGCEKALEDFGKLLVSCDNSDITIQAGDVQFKAHKNILAVRSPALLALLKHEKTSNKISLSDCQPDIFKEFLHYIYTGDVRDLTVENAFALYHVTEKYSADDLNLKCLMHIQDTLCLETFCDVIKLALNYNQTALLQVAIDFASKSIRLILRSSEWQKFNKDHPNEAIEVVIKSLGPQKATEVIKDSEVQSAESDDEGSGDTESDDHKGSQSSENRGIQKVVEDIGKLLVSGYNSDVTVHVGDVEFKAHKYILAARTPVLAAMFEHETVEKISNKISISDCEPDVFKEFLYYIYNGTVQYLTAQNVFSLYRVADKYLTNDLKEMCLMYIQDTLCVETFCDSMQLAVRHEEVGLLRLIDDFATENIRLIIRSVQWQKFNQEQPTEANDILIKSLGPL